MAAPFWLEHSSLASHFDGRASAWQEMQINR